MRRIAAAALLYFGMVFACGFALGAARVLVVAPRLGATGAVLLETPAMLAISWIACRWCVRRLEVGPGARDRLAMGLGAFLLLMAAELGVAVLVFGGSARAWLSGLGTPPGAIGLLAQIAFGLVPLVQRSRPAP